VDLNERFALELQQWLKDDPELVEEFDGSRAALRSWVSERVKAQTESDDMSPAVRRFIRANLQTGSVMEFLAFQKG
jgi:hypothetical protein